MDWKTFISNIIDSLAWPALIAFIVWQLRDNIASLLPRLRKFRHKDTELEFAEGVNELVKDREIEGVDKEPQKEKKPELRDQFDFLVKLADISPRSAVQESFRVLERATENAVIKAYPDLDTRKFRSPLHMQQLLKDKVLSKQQFHEFNQLRTLRNKAAHAPEFKLHGMPIEGYIDIALSLANSLESYEP